PARGLQIAAVRLDQPLRIALGGARDAFERAVLGGRIGPRDRARSRPRLPADPVHVGLNIHAEILSARGQPGGAVNGTRHRHSRVDGSPGRSGLLFGSPPRGDDEVEARTTPTAGPLPWRGAPGRRYAVALVRPAPRLRTAAQAARARPTR